MIGIDTVPVDHIREVLGFAPNIDFPHEYRSRPLHNWIMDADDVILRFIFRNFRPQRHLEFGTWEGDGVIRCVEECNATVWTLNVLEGEQLADGQWAYANTIDGSAPPPWSELHVTDAGTWVRTDAYGSIGRKYLDAGWGKRVCQVYCDSRTWDTRNYPDGFFDSAFIDGGHAYDVVANDTRLAVELVRAGGLIIWHDFCPIEAVTSTCGSTREVVGFIGSELDRLRPFFDKLFWIEPSWLLVGIRAQRAAERRDRI